MKVRELVPGDVVEMAGMRATFVAETQHPIWPNLRLVIWRLSTGEWSHDALDAWQDVGDPVTSTDAERSANLRDALLGANA